MSGLPLQQAPLAGSAGEVFRAALRLGLTSFGGPVAHIGYFHDEYVTRRQWIGAQEFGELVALSNILPGPSSSQVGIAVGVHRAGKLGGLAAWIGFTLPSAVILTALAIWARDADLAGAGWVHGLELAAAAVVLTAVIAMARTLARGAIKAAIAIAATAVALFYPGTFGQVATLLVAAAVGSYVFRRRVVALPLTLTFPISRRTAIVCAQLFVLLFFVPLWLAGVFSSHSLRLFDSFYSAGALVFGGGHVVLPLLNEAVVAPGWVSQQAFLAGYGATQAMPGPLFTFSAYLGAIENPSPNGVAGAAIALVAIFLPSFLLLGAALPLWSAARERAEIQAAVAGVGAAVVGLLAAALWDPVLSTSVHDGRDALAVVVLFLLLRVVPVWAVVGIAAIAGAVLF
jgi:chromate transporter